MASLSFLEDADVTLTTLHWLLSKKSNTFLRADLLSIAVNNNSPNVEYNMRNAIGNVDARSTTVIKKEKKIKGIILSGARNNVENTYGKLRCVGSNLPAISVTIALITNEKKEVTVINAYVPSIMAKLFPKMNVLRETPAAKDI